MLKLLFLCKSPDFSNPLSKNLLKNLSPSVGEYINGNQPSAISAVSSIFLGPIAAKYMGIFFLSGSSINLSGFPKPVESGPLY